MSEATMEMVRTEPITPMALIEMASIRGASIEQMQQLFELKLRVEADEARKAFVEAMVKFKAKPPQINKNHHVEFGTTKYDHATLDHVVDAITPALAAVEISADWEPSYPDAGWVEVACVLTHRLGHSVRRSMKSVFDNSGSKNAIQAQASTITYLERYTLLAATGLAAAGLDNDGRGRNEDGPKMPASVLDEWLDAIHASSSKEEAVKTFQDAYKVAEKIGDKGAIAQLIEAKKKRKEEL